MDNKEQQSVKYGVAVRNYLKRKEEMKHKTEEENKNSHIIKKIERYQESEDEK